MLLLVDPVPGAIGVVRGCTASLRAETATPSGPQTWAQGRPAQPSLRYLKLIREGAADHGLEPSYRAFLDTLQPYTAQTAGQRAGAFLFGTVAALAIFPVWAGERGCLLQGWQAAGAAVWRVWPACCRATSAAEPAPPRGCTHHVVAQGRACCASGPAWRRPTRTR